MSSELVQKFLENQNEISIHTSNAKT